MTDGDSKERFEFGMLLFLFLIVVHSMAECVKCSFQTSQGEGSNPPIFSRTIR